MTMAGNLEQSETNPNEDSSFSIPRGGPIFVPDLVSPRIMVSEFKYKVCSLLKRLKDELDFESKEFDEDISVDDLKIYSDEELVSQAMKIAFQDDEVPGTPSPDLAGNLCSSGVEDEPREMDPDTSSLCESPGGYSTDPSYNGEENDSNLKKRKPSVKVKTNLKNKRKKKPIIREKNKQVDESYLAKVEHLAKLRQKQEEDKTSVKLHSLNHKKDDNILLSSANIRALKCQELFGPLKGKHFAENHVPIPYPEVILCVEVYRYKDTWRLSQELMVLGGQFLTELRDKIRCFTDVVMQKAEDYDPSGYFLIENKFCNDKRDPSAIDYSEPIFHWFGNSKEEVLAKWKCILSGTGKKCTVLKKDMPEEPEVPLPCFESVNMEKTRFCDLPFRLGNGYLYCHQGDCKHKIVIRDMRLVYPEDVQNRASYPLIVYQPKAILQKCSVCAISKATKVTLDDKMAGENPCYFCDYCYYLLHYSAQNTLLYDSFKVHEYLQDYY